MEKQKEKDKNEIFQNPEKDKISSSTKTGISFQNILKEVDSDSDSDFDMDDERLTLIQVIKLIKSRHKNNKNITFINKKRSNPDTNIAYDKLTKKLCDTFCPDYEELDKFLQNCKVSEINTDSLKILDSQKGSKSIFDPFEFMKKNNIKKSILSFEDDLCTYQHKEEIDSHYEIKETIPKLSIPRMSQANFISGYTFGSESARALEKLDFVKIGKILNTNVLDKYQKKWISNFIDKIRKMPMNEVMVKDKKLEIILDLDLTCIFSFVNNTIKSEAILYKERFPEKNIHVLNFEFQSKTMFSSVIIRKGLKEFTNYVKDICNFHIRTQGVLPYALKISEILAEYLNIEFQLVKSRECSKINNISEKCLEDFDDDNINKDNTLIIDDSISAWKKDIANLIQSKKFIDKECGIYSQKEKDKDKSSLDNELTRIQNCYSTFYYHKFENCENLSWKIQTICSEPRCPFYQYRDQNSLNYNFIYSGEYLNSSKLQFFYMKNVIKEIYYMIYHCNVPIFEAIKLVRLNSLYGKSFYLKYLNDQQKNVLSNIIKVCGGEIIENPDDCIDFMIKTVFLVCSMEYYVNEGNSIQEELNKNKKYILINEKYILDSYYFMTDLGNSYIDDEYNPKKVLSL